MKAGPREQLRVAHAMCVFRFELVRELSRGGLLSCGFFRWDDKGICRQPFDLQRLPEIPNMNHKVALRFVTNMSNIYDETGLPTTTALRHECDGRRSSRGCMGSEEQCNAFKNVMKMCVIVYLKFSEEAPHQLSDSI